MTKKKEEKNIKPEETKSTKELIQEAKERYPCFRCGHLSHSDIFTTVDKRPTRVCKKIINGTTPDVCNVFKENEAQPQPITINPKYGLPPQQRHNRFSLLKRKPKQRENIITDCLNADCQHSKENKCTFPKGLTTCEAKK